MGNSIKTGGVGKSPAIEKISRLNELGSRMEAAAALEKQAFSKQQDSARRAVRRRRQIAEEFQINFRKTEAFRQ
ncbi:hypothetical protein AALA79_02205 [Lachnospiraceae bacterium 64-25]|nr:hypothetical protein IMSAGC005_02434 [Lachnospiraceae bacterium]